MAPLVIDVRSAPDSRDVVHRAVQALAEGQVVAVPTETVYGLAASALDEAAVERLLKIKGRTPGHPLTLAVKSAEDALDYVPSLCPLGHRLARRCWPGPVTLVLTDNHRESLTRQLPPGVQRAVCPAGTIGLRVPAHALLLDVLRLLPGPLALSSANRTGEQDAVTASEVIRTLDDQVQLVLDDGRCQFAQPSSVVQVGPEGMKILRAGVVSEATLGRLASLMVLFVCTGNTCRSPMAEWLCRQLLADQLGCRPESVEEHNLVVMSAGIAAMSGGGPSAEAVQVLAEQGLDLRQHVTQPITDRLVRHADLILTMTQAHRQAIVSHWPEAAARTQLLNPDQTDIVDPIGGPLEAYTRCAAQIAAAIQQRRDQLKS